MKKKYIHYRVGLLIGLLSFNTLSSCTSTRDALGMRLCPPTLQSRAQRIESLGPRFDTVINNGTCTLEEVEKMLNSNKFIPWYKILFGFGGAVSLFVFGYAISISNLFPTSLLHSNGTQVNPFNSMPPNTTESIISNTTWNSDAIIRENKLNESYRTLESALNKGRNNSWLNNNSATLPYPSFDQIVNLMSKS